MIKAKEVEIVKKVIRSDGLWRFACRDVWAFETAMMASLDEITKPTAEKLELFYGISLVNHSLEGKEIFE